MKVTAGLWSFCIVFCMISYSGCEAQNASQFQVNPEKIPTAGTMSIVWLLREKGKCEELIEEVDRFVETSTDSNKIGTCLFLKADSLRVLQKYAEATNLFNKVITDYPDAYWIHVPKDGGKRIEKTIYVQPLCRIGLILTDERDTSKFPETSERYTTLAWKYLTKTRYESCRKFAMECINQFENIAKEQQKLHKEEFGESLPKLPSDPEEARPFLEKYWALYDVGTCWFISGQAYQKESQSQSGEKLNESLGKAIECYSQVLKNYQGSQCYDPSGPWYWSVAKGANEQKAIVDRRLGK